jgi:hypothetical protein
MFLVFPSATNGDDFLFIFGVVLVLLNKFISEQEYIDISLVVKMVIVLLL